MKFKLILFSLVFLHVCAFASVKGRVTDKKGEPIPGVNIYWLNSTVGTVSDNSGEFTVPLQSGNNLLVLSNVAFTPDT
ncbi:MAG: carboxypeptidase-like regulatory domain-containing protein, partial [Paludibacter sp.]|nr:carboxypeptidase-like regulatory domain-containing protein [Paludibacter sp.]